MKVSVFRYDKRVKMATVILSGTGVLNAECESESPARRRLMFEKVAPPVSRASGQVKASCFSGLYRV